MTSLKSDRIDKPGQYIRKAQQLASSTCFINTLNTMLGGAEHQWEPTEATGCQNLSRSGSSRVNAQSHTAMLTELFCLQTWEKARVQEKQDCPHWFRAQNIGCTKGKAWLYETVSYKVPKHTKLVGRGYLLSKVVDLRSEVVDLKTKQRFHLPGHCEVLSFGRNKYILLISVHLPWATSLDVIFFFLTVVSFIKPI